MRSMSLIQERDENTNSVCIDGVEIRFVEKHVYFSGVLALRDLNDVAYFLRQVHLRALDSGIEMLTVDITDLKFISASCIRLLSGWVGWILNEPIDKRYVVCFEINPDVSWQSTIIRQIRFLGTQCV